MNALVESAPEEKRGILSADVTAAGLFLRRRGHRPPQPACEAGSPSCSIDELFLQIPLNSAEEKFSTNVSFTSCLCPWRHEGRELNHTRRFSRDLVKPSVESGCEGFCRFMS